MLFAQKNKPRKQQAQTSYEDQGKVLISIFKRNWIKTKFLLLTTERKDLIQGTAEKDISPDIKNMSINSFKSFDTTIVANELLVCYLFLPWPAKQGCVYSALMDDSQAQAEHTCKGLKSWGGILHFQDTDAGFLREEKEDGCWQGAGLLHWLALGWLQAKEMRSGLPH